MAVRGRYIIQKGRRIQRYSSPRLLRSCNSSSVLVTTMATILFETFQTSSIKVDYPDLNGGGPLFGMWNGCPVSAPGKDLTSVRQFLPADVPMVAVPSDFVGFVGNQVPRVEVRHHGQDHDGAACVWASTTWLMTVSHGMDVFFRILWLGDGAGPLPVFRSRLLKSERIRLWSAACAQGLVTTNREDIRGTKRALEQFAQQVRGSAEFEAK